MTQTAPHLDIFENAWIAAQHLRLGGILLYPTETFYAIGCRADNNDAMRLIYRIKERPEIKPLPVLAASMDQAAMASRVDEAPPRLLEIFWPGPLTVVLRATAAGRMAARSGKVAIRVTPCTFAAALANFCGFPIISTSANFSGGRPATNAEDLEDDFLRVAAKFGCGLAISSRPREKLQAAPSTIVEPVRDSSGQWHLRVIRDGCVSRRALVAHNFNILGQS